jgi:hypothetical protein
VWTRPTLFPLHLPSLPHSFLQFGLNATLSRNDSDITVLSTFYIIGKRSGSLVMAPKRSSKKPKKEGPSPALSFLIEPSSPDAVGPSRPRSKVLPFKALGFQDSHLGPKTGESSKKLPGLKPQLANGRGKGKGKEHPVVSDLLWCDCYGPAEIVSCMGGDAIGVYCCVLKLLLLISRIWRSTRRSLSR